MLRLRPSLSDLQARCSRWYINISGPMYDACGPGRGVKHTLKAYKDDIRVRYWNLCVHHGCTSSGAAHRCNSSTLAQAAALEKYQTACSNCQCGDESSSCSAWRDDPDVVRIDCWSVLQRFMRSASYSCTHDDYFHIKEKHRKQDIGPKQVIAKSAIDRPWFDRLAGCASTASARPRYQAASALRRSL
jgi:hypothetical protein